MGLIYLYLYLVAIVATWETNVVVECVELLVHNRKFLGSDLVPEIGCPKRVLVLFVSLSANMGLVLSIY
jgi:hypothetical protein